MSGLHHFHSATNPKDAILVGCVAYSETVGTIWEGMRQYFMSKGVPFDFVMFTTYDRQVEALMSGQIDIAWNGPLAHVRVQKRTDGKSISLGMRDADCGFCSYLVVSIALSMHHLCVMLLINTIHSPPRFPLHGYANSVGSQGRRDHRSCLAQREARGDRNARFTAGIHPAFSGDRR